MGMTFEILQGVSLAGSKSFKQKSSFDEVCYCPLYFKKKKLVPAHTLHQLQAHILNTDLVNYSLRLELFKKLTLSLMQFNGKQTTTHIQWMYVQWRSTEVSSVGLGCPVDVTPRMRMV